MTLSELKQSAIRVVARVSPSALRFLAHRNPIERGRWPTLNAFMTDEKCRAWLASLENPTKTRRGFRIFTLEGDLTSDWIKLHGMHETGTERFILDHLRPNSTFLDIGANVGYFSLLAALTGNAKVVSFEPQAQIADLLSQSVRFNRIEDAVRVETLALSNQAGTMRMTSCPGNTGHAQLVSGSSGDIHAVPVSVVVLDEWLAKNPVAPVSVCKIDTEGAELQVLAGMSGLLERDGPAIVIEVIDEFLGAFGASGAKIWQLLQAFGYTEVSKAYMVHSDRNRYFVRRSKDHK